jgi:hypothetical protein
MMGASTIPRCFMVSLKNSANASGLNLEAGRSGVAAN